MKLLMILSIPLILSMSIMLGLGSADSGVFAQQANQTSPQANQTSPQANQTSPQANQTSPQANQTASQMTDKLLSLANDAQRALNEGNETAVAESVGQIQGTLINASQAEGKQVVIIPSDVISENAEDVAGVDSDADDEGESE